jgi:hypothetical protein
MGATALAGGECMAAQPATDSSDDSKTTLLDFKSACPTAFSMLIPDF